MRLLRLVRRDTIIGFRTLGGVTLSLVLTLVLYIFVASLSYNSIVVKLRVMGRAINYVEFLAPGLAAIAVAETSFIMGSLYWIDRRVGMFEQLVAGPFTREEYAASKILTAAIYSLAYTALTIALVSLLSPCTGLEMLRTLLATPIASTLFASMGLCAATRVRSPESYNMLINTVLIPLFLLSPAYYPLQAMPTPIRCIALANPLTYVVEAFRSLMLAPERVLKPLTIVTTMAAVLTVLALAMFRRMEVTD